MKIKNCKKHVWAGGIDKDFNKSCANCGAKIGKMMEGEICYFADFNAYDDEYWYECTKKSGQECTDPINERVIMACNLEDSNETAKDKEVSK